MVQRDYLDTTAIEQASGIKKQATVTFDGKQYTIKIPQKIAKILKLQKGNKVLFTLDIPENSLATKANLTIKLI